ncbi:hypothetical protein I5M32_11315 [Pedobacter sp. SD-b]|uniref:Phage protein n=1 Tax=Pedobacter segetis TaxID=2793069 RepID=A0ABS1BML3_9SPHI|nr:hypothetical protein [Pedobacter segetis]MBK0383546.1 hypothetical protein [Pedobacter segetis]
MKTEINNKSTDTNANNMLADAVCRPILFSTPMVQAILNGTKTQTRRQVKGMALDWLNDGFTPEFVAMKENGFGKANVGDIFWVRETFGKILSFDKYCYRADVESKYDKPALGWKPSIFMPRDACRIWLEVTGKKIERLRDIFHVDARNEGVDFIQGISQKLYYNYLTLDYGCNELFSFMTLWQKINGEKSWEENPWVWVYSFKRIECPEGFR